VAVQARVFRFVDDTHATTAEFFDDPVVGDDLLDHAWPETKAAAMLGGARVQVK
jgi:hypothetical protein